MKIVKAMQISLKELQNRNINIRFIPKQLNHSAKISTGTAKQKKERIEKSEISKRVERFIKKSSIAENFRVKLQNVANLGLIFNFSEAITLQPFSITSRNFTSKVFIPNDVRKNQMENGVQYDSDQREAIAFDLILESVSSFVDGKGLPSKVGVKDNMVGACISMEHFMHISDIFKLLQSKLITHLLDTKIATKLLIEELLRYIVCRNSVHLLENAVNSFNIKSYLYAIQRVGQIDLCGNDSASAIAIRKYRENNRITPKLLTSCNSRNPTTSSSFSTTSCCQFHSFNGRSNHSKSSKRNLSQKNTDDREIITLAAETTKNNLAANQHPVLDLNKVATDDWQLDTKKILVEDASGNRASDSFILASKSAKNSTTLSKDESLDNDDAKGSNQQRSGGRNRYTTVNSSPSDKVQSDSPITMLQSSVTDTSAQTIRLNSDEEKSALNLNHLSAVAENAQIAEETETKSEIHAFRSTRLQPEFIKPRLRRFTIDLEDEDVPHVAMFDTFCTPVARQSPHENIVPIRVIPDGDPELIIVKPKKSNSAVWLEDFMKFIIDRVYARK